MVLDDQDRVAEIGEAIQDVEQLLDVVEVQARRGLIENVESAAGLATREFFREFDALRLAAGKSRRRLAELDVAEANVHQRIELLANLRNVFENFERVGDLHVKQVGNRVAFVAHGQSFRVVAASAADFARYIHIGKKIHFNAAQAVALACFAAPALHVEAEPARAIAALARFGQHGEQLSDGSEDASVCGRVRPRRASDGRLIDFDDFVDLRGAFDFAERSRTLHRAVERLR